MFRYKYGYIYIYVYTVQTKYISYGITLRLSLLQEINVNKLAKANKQTNTLFVLS